LTPSKQQAIAVKPALKKVPAGATNLHGPWQQVLPLSNKSNDYMNNIQSDISVGTKPNQRSSWSDSIISEECSNKLRVQDAKIKHPKNKLFFAESSSLPTTQGTIPTHVNICKENKVPHFVETPNRLLHCKREKAVSSEHFASVNLHDTQSTTIEHHEEMAIAKSTDIASTPVQTVLEPFCDDHVKPFIEVVDDFVGLSLMSQEVHHDSTTVVVKGQRSGIFQSECKIKDKIYKRIIDGGSFTNVISLDLMSALSLSMWRLPTLRYVEWMNQCGTLKITYKARVKFSAGNYMDTRRWTNQCCDYECLSFIVGLTMPI
jgi:hypothetical protein